MPRLTDLQCCQKVLESTNQDKTMGAKAGLDLWPELDSSAWETAAAFCPFQLGPFAVQSSFSSGIRLQHNHFHNYYLNAMFMFDYREQGQQQKALPAGPAGPSALALLLPLSLPCSALIDIFSMHIETHPWPRSPSSPTSFCSFFLPSVITINFQFVFGFGHNDAHKGN